MDNISRRTLLRTTQNDPSLAYLVLRIVNNNTGFGGKFYSDNSDDYSALGAAIANNTHLSALRVWLSDDLPLGVANRGFYDGLKSNSSISDVQLSCNHITIAGGVGQEILKAYQEKNSQLTALRIIEANLQNGGDRVIVNTLRSSRNLQKVVLNNCNITDAQLLPIVDALRGHRLEVFSLLGNNIGNPGCNAIASLLDDPNSNIHTIGLGSNSISNEGATIIANSLTNNKQLQELFLYDNPIDQGIQDVFSNLICNATSIEHTYSCNHSLGCLSLDPHERGQHLQSLLELNRDANKNHVAMKKIFQCYRNIDMEPLFVWGFGARDFGACNV